MHAPFNGTRTRRDRRRLRPLALALILTFALPATALAANFKITPHLANHTPTINVKWPVRLTITRGKTRLSGSVKYQFLFQGSVVGHQPGHKFTHGTYTDTMIWPSDSFGEPLTLRILVTVPKHGTEHLDWTITTQK
jgi:hypothetical protein